jgi:hypothetical protein
MHPELRAHAKLPDDTQVYPFASVGQNEVSLKEICAGTSIQNSPGTDLRLIMIF